MKRGFTLLEILLVLALLLLGLGLLSQLSGIALREAVRSEDETAVAIFCRSLMNEIQTGSVSCRDQQTWSVPSSPAWSVTASLLPGRIPNLTVLKLRAQKYEEAREPAEEGRRTPPQLVPVAGEHILITQWLPTRLFSKQNEAGPEPDEGSFDPFVGSLQFLPGGETETDLFRDAGFPPSEPDPQRGQP